MKIPRNCLITISLSTLLVGTAGCTAGGGTSGGATPPDAAADDERLDADALAPADAVTAVAQQLAQGEATAALSLVDEALARAPRDPELHLARGAVLQALRRGDEAIVAWEQALTLAPEMYGALDGIGTVHLDAGRPDVAVKFFRRALDIRPDFAAGQYNYALALRQVGALDRALEAIERARSLDPEDAEILLEQASMLEAAGRVEEARAAVHAAAAKAPQDAWIQMVHGDVLAAEGKSAAEVLEAYRDALRLEPSLAPARARLLRVLLRTGELDEALAVTAAAVERGPEDALAWSDHAAAQHARGDLQGALESLDRALALNSTVVAAHRRRVRVYGALGRCEEAREAVAAMGPAGVDGAQVERARGDLQKACAKP